MPTILFNPAGNKILSSRENLKNMHYHRQLGMPK
jgi:hypothetical protein